MDDFCFCHPRKKGEIKDEKYSYSTHFLERKERELVLKTATAIALSKSVLVPKQFSEISPTSARR